MPALDNIRTVSVPSVGKIPLAEDPGTFTPSGITREHKPGRLPEDGGFIESSTPARLQLNIRQQAALDIDALNAIENEDVTVRLASGKVYMLAQASVEKPVDIGNGDTELALFANQSTEI